MIKQINQHIGKKYSISKPVFLTIPKHQDFGKKKDKFLGRLNKLRTEYGLKDNDTLGLYHQKWWEAFILNKKKDVSSKVLEGLVRRWAFFEKKYSIPMMRKDIEDEKKELLRDGIRPLVISLTSEEKEANQIYLKKMENETGVKPHWLSTTDGE